MSSFDDVYDKYLKQEKKKFMDNLVLDTFNLHMEDLKSSSKLNTYTIKVDHTSSFKNLGLSEEMMSEAIARLNKDIDVYKKSIIQSLKLRLYQNL